MQRLASAAGSDAYQGAFEAIGAVLVGGGFGYWADLTWDTSPWGLLIGIGLGFAAMVLRLLRLGKELELESGSEAAASGPGLSDDLGVGEAPGLSDLLHADEAPDEGAFGGTPANKTTETNTANKKIDEQ